jgi:arginyl-tRNA synthetase
VFWQDAVPMERFRREIAEALSKPLARAAEAVAPLLEYPPAGVEGDLAFPCFGLARELRKSPAAIAADLAGASFPPCVEWARPAGAYLNFGLRGPELFREVLTAARAKGDAFGNSAGGRGRTVVVDYSSPNISKHLAFHHIRSTMIGQALVNLHRACGWRTVGINHLGDWGTTFGQLMVAVEAWGGEGFLERASLTDLNEQYVRFHREAEADPGLEDRARAWFKRLEDRDPAAVRMWEAFRRISLEEFQRAYDRLGVRFDHVTGESFYLDRLEGTVAEAREAGITRESEGALVVELDGGLPPALLRKSDGATLYITRDLAAARYRFESFGFDRALYVTDAGQGLHFRQLFGVLRALGAPFADRMAHVPFGVLLMGGHKGKSRKGEVVLLEDVLDEAVSRALGIVREKNPSLQNAGRVAEQVGIGAVVFNDLKNKRIKDVQFRWEEVLNLEGDSGPYVQYAHVRACGIFRKLEGAMPEAVDFSLLREPEERDLARLIGRFPEVVLRACDAYEPSTAAQHLLEVSAAFHRFHHRHRVLGEDRALSAARLWLVDGVRLTLRNGLGLLGIAAPEEM